MARKLRSVISPGKAGVNHGIKKPIAKPKKRPNVLERIVKSTRSKTETKRKVFGDLTNGEKDTESDVEEEVKNEPVEDKVEPYDSEMDGLCEYERIRLQNIREREEMFKQLELNDAKSSAFPVTPLRNKSNPSSRGLQSEKKVKEVLPPRRSARVAGGKVPEIERFVPLIEEPPADRCPSLEVLTVEESLMKSESKENSDDLLKSLMAPTKICPSERLAVRAEVSRLTISEEQVAKVVPDRIFSVSVHPGSQLVVATGGKQGHVGLWDVMATHQETHGVHLFQPHERPVNCLSWNKANSSQLVTTSYDGTSRILDCQSQQWMVLYGEQEYIEAGGWTSFHAQVCPYTFLISQGDTGSVVMLDTRVGWSSPVTTCRVTDRVHPKSVSLHPLQSQYFLTGTNKAGCFIFDVRTASSGRALMKPVCELTGHSRSLSSCVFSSQTGGQVATLSSDDKLRLYDTSKLQEVIRPQCKVHHNNQTGRWLTPLRLTWHPAVDNLLLSGSMARPRQMEMWDTEDGNIDLVAQLQGDDLASVCSIVDIHPQTNVVIGGNSSGRLHVFK